MPYNPKTNYERFTRCEAAWATLRPEKSFAGISLDDFRAKIAPCLAARATIARLDNELLAALHQRDTADTAAHEALLLLADAIKGDPEEGPDGELYEALGYVRRSDRKSGLSRKTKVEAAAPKD